MASTLNLLRPDEIKPDAVANPDGPSQGGTVDQALMVSVLTDIDRTTRGMGDQMRNIIAGLENDIDKAKVVRDMAIKRIDNLSLAREAALASVEVLIRKG